MKMVIRDIIGKTNSNIDTTINVVQFRNKPNSVRQIMNTIITPNFKKNLIESLESIADQMIRTGNTPKSQSFFIEGMFGTGKSHFLSFLNTLFDETIETSIRDLLWEKVEEVFDNKYSELRKKKFLVVPIALHGRLQADLIDIIFREIEKLIFERFEIKVNLSSPSKFIDFYERNCRPGTKADIENMISEEFEDMDLEKFDMLDEEEDRDFYRKAEIIRESMKKLNLKIDDSFKIGDDIEKFIKLVLQETFEQISTELINKPEIGYDGIVLLIDEFSEYLKSQKESEIDEQGRKRTLASLQLQYLVEFIREKDFFIFIAAQEELYSLDPLFEKQTGSGGRLRTLNLEFYHFVEIFNQIILPEKENFRNNIESMFPTLKTQYFIDFEYSIYDTKNPTRINKDIFFECYPFHPKTIDLLIDHVFELSTKTRAGISYTSFYVEKTLNNEVEELITPDTLFDYFKKEIKIRDHKKYRFIKNLNKEVQAENEVFSKEEKEIISKVLKYIYLNQNPVYAEDCIINLFLNYDDDEKLEDLLNKLVTFSKREFQFSYLRKILKPENNKQIYYLQVRGTYDTEDIILIQSQKIQDLELYEYFIDKFFDYELSKGNFLDVKIKNKKWRMLEYYIKFEAFEEKLNEIVNDISDLPKWTARGIEFNELFIFQNLPFKDEFENFQEGVITKFFIKYENIEDKLEDRLYFIRIKPFNELLISEIKKCLAFDLLNSRFHSVDKKWHGADEIQQRILIGNDELLHSINNFYNENIQENKDDILAELGKRQHEYSFGRESPIYVRIRNHYLENLSFINKMGTINIGNKDKVEVLEDIMEDVINKYYPKFPEFLADTDYTRLINVILGELSKDQKTFEVPARNITQVKGTAVIKIGIILGIFSEVETMPSSNKIFKMGLSEENIFFTELMPIIPTEEDIDENKAELISLSRVCEFLYENFGFSLKISRIFLATLLNQDKIKITNRSGTLNYNNLHVKRIFEDSIRDFSNLYIFQTKKLTPDEIIWLFSFYNALFEGEEEYVENFSEELNNIEEIDDIKSSKQQTLKSLLENYNLDVIEGFSDEFEDLLNTINQKQD